MHPFIIHQVRYPSLWTSLLVSSRSVEGNGLQSIDSSSSSAHENSLTFTVVLKMCFSFTITLFLSYVISVERHSLWANEPKELRGNWKSKSYMQI